MKKIIENNKRKIIIIIIIINIKIRGEEVNNKREKRGRNGINKRDKERPVMSDIPEGAHEFVRGEGVKAGGGFIKEDERRISEHLDTDTHSPPLPTTQAGMFAISSHPRSSAIGQPQLDDHFVHYLLLLFI